MDSDQPTIKIFPSILSADFNELGKEVERIEKGGADGIHIDVMDGHFVPNISYGFPVIEALKRVTELPTDVHLMISNPEKFVDGFCDLGIDYLSFHPMGTTRRNLEKIKKRGVKAGLALNPNKGVGIPIERYISDGILDYILIMSVYPGFGGQKFMPEVLKKASFLREIKPGIDIQIDGGIKADQTAYDAARSGINMIVSGSGVFNLEYRNENYKKSIDILRKCAMHGWKDSVYSK